MELYTYNFTDFASWGSPCLEMWLAEHELGQFGQTIAHDMVTSNPDLLHKGLCVAIYDREGKPVSISPLDTVH
jgi:hypothetical protein